MNPLSNAPAYSLGEKILRTAVFQIAVDKGFVEHALMKIFNIFSQKTCFAKAFDPQKAEQGLKSLIELGAEVEFVTPKDQKASIQMVTLRSLDLEKRLNALGAQWEEITLDQERSILAIIPPETPSEEWTSMEKNLLRLKWEKRFIPSLDREVIVSCENAHLITPQQCHQNLFLHSNSASVSFTMLSRRMGFYLGMKQTGCFYDLRGTWKSTGVASEAGFYNDIEAVYEKIKVDYAPQNIWLTAACAGCCPAAYLKAKYHQTGINLILENSFTDLKADFMEPEGWFVSRFANYFWAGLKSRDIPDEVKPPETDFNVEALWKDLKKVQNGKILVVDAINDQRLSAEVNKHNIALAQRVNEQVFSLHFESQWKEDPHFDRYFKYPEPTQKAIEFIFKA